MQGCSVWAKTERNDVTSTSAVPTLRHTTNYETANVMTTDQTGHHVTIL